ncbi:hypothetical protein F8M41_003247 [Gigaspora margarita]|uniref:Uncharacterized protein n=1 Tax=Gigaspora margarita TaxID=4874 RepID=A0A8H4A6D9_GIGMA|nr:hypothetical protein F8M41_003247 [Gigaspora margarita]
MLNSSSLNKRSNVGRHYDEMSIENDECEAWVYYQKSDNKRHTDGINMVELCCKHDLNASEDDRKTFE